MRTWECRDLGETKEFLKMRISRLKGNYLSAERDLAVISGLASFIQVVHTYLLWIATELGDVILDEIQGGLWILQADVQVMKRNLGTCKLRNVCRQI
jgi:hypothetical protein